ncbi:MAG: TetR family transcriptional regulator C-terminal domain-containing protein, partial [Alteraurantiacibacter sp.]
RNSSNRLLTRLFTIVNVESLTEDHPAQEWFAGRSRTALEIFTAFFREGIERGEIRADVDPVQVSAEIVAMMDGLQIWWLRLPEDVDMANVFVAYLSRLEAAIVVE